MVEESEEIQNIYNHEEVESIGEGFIEKRKILQR
jgi:hypothetical protein